MKKTVMKIKTFMMACMLMCATASLAANGVWNGTGNALWSNSANWSLSPYPSGNDTAFFTNSGSGQTLIDLAGLSSIRFITYDTPAVAAYTNGTGAANSQTLIMVDGGEFKLTDTAANSQLFNCAVQLGATVIAQNYSFKNDNLTKTLTFNNVFGSVAGGGTAGDKNLTISGAGNTTILGNMTKGGATRLIVTDTSSGTLTLSGSNIISVLIMNGGPNSVVDIGSGYLSLDNLGDRVVESSQGGTINGTGTIRFSTAGGNNYGDVRPAAGRTLVINPSIISDGGFELNAAGTVVLNGTNTFALDVFYTTSGGTISVSKIGNKGSLDSNLGKGTKIFVTDAVGCTLRYTGIGETTDRIMEINRSFTIDHSGTGELCFSAPFNVLANTKTLTLQGSTLGVGRISGNIGPGTGTTSLTKNGSGTWILSGVNTYAGATTVNAGKLLFNTPGTSAGSAVTVNSGALLGGNTTINGNVTINAGGMLAPGDVGTIGTMSLGVNLALNGSTLLFDVSAMAADTVAVSGVLTLNSANTILLAFPEGTLPAGTYTLMTFASRIGTGTFSLSPAYTNASLVLNATSLQLVVSDTGIVNKIWKGNNSGSWETDANWTNGSAAVVFAPGDAVLFDDTASLFNVTSASPVSPSSVLFNNNSNTYTVSAAMDGTWDLLKLGAGNVTLSGVNTYAGQTTIAGGILTLSGAGVLGNGNYETNIINNGEFNYASSAVQTNSGGISGIGALTLSGSGTMILAGTNTYTGATTVTGPGTLTISGDNAACSGPTTVNAGVLKALSASALGTTTAGTTVNTNGTLELAGNIVTLAEPLSLFGTLSSQTGSNTYAGTVTFNAGAILNVGAGSTNILSASTVGAGAITKTGAGLLMLTRDPNHTGAMTINGGAVELANNTTDGDFVINSGGALIGNTSDAINAANSVTVNAGGAYVLRQSDTINMFSGAGTLTKDNTGAATLTVGNSNGSSTFSGVIQDGSGMISFAKIGTGIQTLSGMNTYTGLTTVTAGTLSLRGPTALPALSAVSMNVATLQVLQDGSGNNGIISVGNSITRNAGGAATIDVGNNGSGNTGNTVAFGALNNGTSANALDSNINFTGTNGYQQSFTSLALPGNTGNNTYLRPTTTSVTILGNVTNQMTVMAGHYDTLFLEGTSTNNKILGVISDAAGYTSVNNGDTRITKNNTSTWTLAGANTYRGPTVVNGGTLLINGSISSISAVTVASGATLGGFGTIQGGGATLSAGALLAPGDVNAVGTLSITNTLTLNGNTLIFDVSNVATDKVAVARALTVNNANTVMLNFPDGPIAAGTYTLMTFASKTGTGTFALASPYPNASLSTPGNTSLVLTVAGGETSWGRTWKGDLSTSWDGAAQNWRIGSVATNFATGDAVTFDDTATDFSVSSAALVAPSSILFNNRANNYTVSAAIGGTVPLVMSGSATVALTGTNTFSGSTIINAGTLTISGAGLLGNSLYAGNITNNGVFNYASSVTQTNSGIISGAGTLSVSSSGTLVLSGVNTYTGPTVVNAGVLKVLNGSGLGTVAGTTIVNPGGTLELEGNVVTLAEPLSLFGSLSSQSGSNTYAGVVSLQTGSAIDVGSGSKLIFTASTPDLGAYPFTKTGSGLLRMIADPNHRGVCTIAEGTLELEHTGSTDAKFIINSGATLRNMGANQNLGDYDIQADGTFDVQVSDQIGGLLGSGTVTIGRSAAYTLSVGGSNLSGDFSGVMQNGSGTLGFTKNGAGVQTLSGLSTYSGTTTLNAGQLNINNGGSAGTSSAIGVGTFVINGGVIDNTSAADVTLSPVITQFWSNNFTFAGSKSLNLGTGAVTLSAARTVTVLANTLTVGGAIGGSFSLTKAGAGTLTLSGVNTYNGGTILNGGKLFVNSPGSLAAGAVTNSSNSSGVVLGGNGSISGAVTLHPGGMLSPGAEGSAGTLSLGSTLTLNGIPLLFDVSNVATDTVVVASALTLNGTNSVVLAFPAGEIQAGTYTLMTFASRTGSGTFVLSPAYANCSLVTNATSVALLVAGPAGFSGVTWRGNQSANWNTTDQNWTNSSGAAAYTDGNGVTFDDTAVGNFTITSNIGGVAPGAILFNNSLNNYSLTAPINNTAPLMKMGAGSATLSGMSAYNPLSITVGAGTLTLGGTSQLNSGLYAGDIFNNGALIFASASSQTYSGVISGMGALTLSGGGTLTLSGTNTYAGPTVINAGVLKIQNGSGLGTTAAGTTVALGAKLVVEGNISIPAETLDLYGILSSPTGSNTYAGLVSLRTGSSIDVEAGSILILSSNTVNTGASPFSKTGAGTLRLTADPNHVGVCTVAEGTLEIRNTSGATDAEFFINPGATLMETFNALGNFRLTVNGIFDLRASDDINGLDGSGLVTIGTGSPYNFTVGNGGQSGLFSGVIGNGVGTLSFIKTGAGTQALTGTNTYTGVTTVGAGTLLVNYPGSLAAGSSVTVANAAILGGNGTINGSVTLSAGGNLAPGGVSVIGTLTLGSSLTLNGNTLFFDFSNVAQDKVAVAAALTASGANTVLVSGTPPAGDYILMTFASQTVATPFVLAGISDASLELTSTNLVLHVTSGSSASGLTWRGDKSAVWDGGILNWLNNSAPAAFAVGDAVLFDDTAVGNFTVNSGSAVSPSSVQFNNSLNTYTVSASMGGSSSVSKFGTGTANLSGANTYSGPTSIGQGTLAITAAGQLGSGLYAAKILNNGTFNYASSAAQSLSGDISGSGGLTVSGSGALTLAGTNTLAWVNVNGGAAGSLLTLSGSMSIPGAAGNLTLAGAANDRSVFKQNGTLTLGNNFNIGNANPSAGACYQTSGITTVTNYLGVGSVAGGYGYYRLSGGTLNVRGYLEIATSGSGVFDLFDGILSTENTFDIDRRSGGVGVLNVFGGIAKAPSNGNPMQMGRNDFAGPAARLTVMGSGVVDAANGSGTTKILDMNAGNGNGGTTAVNLLTGGTLIANKVSATRVGTTVFNFDGGTLKASPLTTVGATFLTGLDSAIVYPGGAVIDTTNASITITQSLRAPVGHGISAISLISNGAGYIGAPLVNITGGSGTGVTAIASVDLADGSPTKGRVTGITMTSKGTGYKNTDVLTVALSGGGFTTAAVTGACTFAANSAAGGLTKLGSGILTLSGTNTYGGATTISNGTLQLGIANALPTNSVVNVNGGSYELGGFTVTNSAVNMTAGAIVRGNLNSPSLVKDGGGVVNFNVLQTVPAPVIINGGTFSLSGAPGLYEGRVAGAFELGLPNPQTAVRMSPTNAYRFFSSSGVSGGIWVDNSTYIYTGVIWNRSPTNETWTFCKSFDDSVRIMVDNTPVINVNGGWDTVTTANHVMTPGPHAFEVRLGQGGGAVGQANNKTVPGAGFDRQGRSNSAFCVPIVDPGDGSLLTLSVGKLANASTVELAANTMLDLGTTAQTLAGLSGSGTVSNGALTVTGTISPAATNTIGTLTAKANTTLSGKLLASVATDGTSDLLDVQSNLTLLSPTLEIVDLQGLSTLKVYTLITSSNPINGSFASTNIADTRWALRYTVDNKVQLYYKSGTMIRIL